MYVLDLRLEYLIKIELNKQHTKVDTKSDGKVGPIMTAFTYFMLSKSVDIWKYLLQ